MALRLYSLIADFDVEILSTEQLTDAKLGELYRFSNSLMEETDESFRNHIKLVDVAYVFRDQSKRIVGLSCWRTVPTTASRVKMIVQGKLRVAIAYRRRGLHIVAGLAYYIREQWRNLRTTFLFISIASIYNFASMKKSIYQYWILNKPQLQHPRLLSIAYASLKQLIEDDHFEVREDGAIYVHVRIADSIVKEFPAEFYASAEAQEYITANPNWRDANDLAYCYPFSFLNIVAMIWRIVRLLLQFKFPQLFLR